MRQQGLSCRSYSGDLLHKTYLRRWYFHLLLQFLGFHGVLQRALEAGKHGCSVRDHVVNSGGFHGSQPYAVCSAPE